MPNKVIKYKDGSEYSGKVDDKGNRHDKGKLTLANGEKYVGEWKNDKKDGQGVYYNTDGSILKRGFWRDDIFLKKSEYFKIKDQKKLREKFSNLLQEYSDQESEAGYKFSDRYGDYPEKHPFEDAPTELMDDEEFLLNCLETDYAQCFKFASERLRNKKDFVLEVLKYAYPEHEHIGDDLKHDLDIIIKTKLKDFSKFGDLILNDKSKLSQIIKSSSSKHFESHEFLPDHIRSDKSFFLSLLKSEYSERCLQWADESLKSDKKIVESYLKKSPEAISFVSSNMQSYEKYVAYAVSKKGELLLNEVDPKFLKIKSYVLKAAKTFGEIFVSIDKKLRKDKQVVLACLKSAPKMLKRLDKKFLRNDQIVLPCLEKDPYMIKYCNKKLRKDKKLFIKLYNKKTDLFADSQTDGSMDKTALDYFDKKIMSDTKILALLINKRGKKAGYPNSDRIVHTVCKYLNKSGNQKLIELALKKSEYYFEGLNKKYRDNKKIVLMMVKHGNQYMYKNISDRLRIDPEVLEVVSKKYLKGYINFKTKKINYHNINDVEGSSSIHWDSYWYIYYKKNPNKITNKVEHVESVRIKSHGMFEEYEEMYYTGDFMNGRPHGKGYASNEEGEVHGDAAFIHTYNGDWKDGLPDGKGEYKSYAPNHYPPDGKIESHYIGEFSKGEEHGKGKKYNEDGKPKWKKVEYINGKIKNEKK